MIVVAQEKDRILTCGSDPGLDAQVPEPLERHLELNMETYPSGIYFIRLSNQKGNIIKKLIVKR